MFMRIAAATLFALLTICSARAGDLTRTPLVVPAKNQEQDVRVPQYRDHAKTRRVESTATDRRREN